MTQQVPNWFIEKYNDEVKHLAQQKTRRLGDTTSGGGTFVGDKVYFPRMGAVEMYDSAAFAQITLANAKMDFIELTAEPKFVAFGIWDAHKNKLSINLAKEYAKASLMAVYRREDKMIADALRAAAAAGGTEVTTLGAYDSVATMDDIAEAIATLGENEYFEGEDITVALPWRNKLQFSLDHLFHNKNVRAEDMPWADVNWRTYQGLTAPTDNTGVDIFVYARSAVVSGYNDQMTPIKERIGGALTDMIGFWNQGGATVREGKGVIRVKAKKSFSLTREPIPMLDVIAAEAEGG